MSEDLSLASELADLAAQIALARSHARDFTTTSKADGSPVTDVDRQVERALGEHIARHRHARAVVGEEYGPSGLSEFCWHLDPLDGTSRFVTGQPPWMTPIALHHPRRSSPTSPHRGPRAGDAANDGTTAIGGRR